MGALGVSALLTLTKLLDDTRAKEIKSIVKAYSSSGNTSFVPYLTSDGIAEYQDVVKTFILGAPINSATKRFLGISKTSVGVPTC